MDMTLRRVLPFLALALGACFPNNSTDVSIPDPIALEQQTWGSTLNVSLSAFTKLPSGVYVLDTQVGTGPTLSGLPTVRVFYTGYLANGTRFDGNVGASSPATFPLGSLIQGWQVGMQGMKVGGRRRLLIPSSLGYGPVGAGGAIPPNANLVFDIELNAIA
jgi:FKBP-type peptidyl-prolyl cis-trans isomerase